MDLPLEIIPLGGLGRIGMNCMLVGRRGRWILIDAGIEFPPITMIGADRLLPDINFLQRMADRIEAVVITHGHEDHIGALPWVLPVLDAATPIWASDFTTELIHHRLREHGLWEPDRMRAMTPGQRFDVGPFEIEPIRVTHSIPDCCSLALRSEDGTILHTGDWKIDEQPADGEVFDRDAFARLGDEGVTLMLSDSTNVLSPGRTRSETEVADHLLGWIEGWDKRVVVTQFASNLHRMRALARAAEATERTLVFCGRSLWRYYEAAFRTGREPFASGRAIGIEDARDLDPRRALVVTTGSQGERMSALTRAAEGTHRHLAVGSGDLVLHSARVIPGNEAGVYEMFNNLAQRGARLVTGRHTGIHASGHARQDELAELLNIVRPAHFVPVHGEYTFLQAHADLAERCHLPAATVLQNGERFSFGAGPSAGTIRDTQRTGMETLETLYNDGPATGDADAMRLKERKRIAWNGVVVVDLAVERLSDRALRATAAVETRCIFDDDDSLAARLAVIAERAARKCPPRTPLSEVKEAVSASVKRGVRKSLGKRPDVIVVMHGPDGAKPQ